MKNIRFDFLLEGSLVGYSSTRGLFKLTLSREECGKAQEEAFLPLSLDLADRQRNFFLGS